jgi:hypothetical protein
MTQPGCSADHQSCREAVAGQIERADEAGDERPQDEIRACGHDKAGGCAAHHEREAAMGSRERLGCGQSRADSGGAEASGDRPKRTEGK